MGLCMDEASTDFAYPEMYSTKTLVREQQKLPNALDILILITV